MLKTRNLHGVERKLRHAAQETDGAMMHTCMLSLRATCGQFATRFSPRLRFPGGTNLRAVLMAGAVLLSLTLATPAQVQADPLVISAYLGA